LYCVILKKKKLIYKQEKKSFTGEIFLCMNKYVQMSNKLIRKINLKVKK